MQYIKRLVQMLNKEYLKLLRAFGPTQPMTVYGVLVAQFPPRVLQDWDYTRLTDPMKARTRTRVKAKHIGASTSSEPETAQKTTKPKAAATSTSQQSAITGNDPTTSSARIGPPSVDASVHSLSRSSTVSETLTT